MPGPQGGWGESDGLTSFLGWFSVGLGLAQMAVPREFARLIGGHGGITGEVVTRMVGLRELASGVGILTTPRPVGWLTARTAGDAMDLALLGSMIVTGAPRPGRTLLAMAAVAGISALDAYEAARRAQPRGETPSVWLGGPIEVRKAITVAKPVAEVYGFWHELSNLPRFMAHLESVELIGPGRSRWTARGPAGFDASWEAETTEDRPNERIAWRSLPGSMVENSGSVEFRKAPGDQGTEVHVALGYVPPGGPLGVAVAKVFGEAPDQQLQDDLRLFKQVMETGEVVLAEGSLEGARLLQRPGQPFPQDETPTPMSSKSSKATATARERANGGVS